MADQIYFEDVEEGTELPTLRKDPTTQQLVMYAGASGTTTRSTTTGSSRSATGSPT